MGYREGTGRYSAVGAGGGGDPGSGAYLLSGKVISKSAGAGGGHRVGGRKVTMGGRRENGGIVKPR